MGEAKIITSLQAAMEMVTNTEKTKTIRKGSSPTPGTYWHIKVGSLVSTTRTRSIKLSNISQDLRQLFEIFASAAVTVATPDPIVIAAGLLILISSFSRVITIELSDQQVSVFCGLILAGDEKKKPPSMKFWNARIKRVRMSVSIQSVKVGSDRR